MAEEQGALSLDDLRRYKPFSRLDDDQLLLLSYRVKLQLLSAKKELFRCGDTDTNEYFLVDGTLRLTAQDGKTREIAADDDIALSPIARLRPRQYTATAIKPVSYFVVQKTIVDRLDPGAGTSDELAAMDVHEVPAHVDPGDHNLLMRFGEELETNRFTLPSLPEIAIKVRQMVEEEHCNLDKISTVINADPAIAAKLIKAANSPIFRGESEVESAHNAVVRLGLNTIKQLVLGFTIRDLYRAPKPELKRLMVKAWANSMDVSAISSVIADMSPVFKREDALLVGLLHNVGIIGILSFAAIHPELFETEEELEQVIERLSGDIGGLILERWGFDDEYVAVSRECGNWSRDHDSDADLCDLVMIAKIHHQMGNKSLPAVPKFDQIPAFSKLQLGEITPDLTIQILAESRELIAETRKLFVG